MMVNFTNINKMNNNRSSYLTPLNTKETTTYDVGNPKVEDTKRVIGIGKS
jgi:hypothetical protein